MQDPLIGSAFARRAGAWIALSAVVFAGLFVTTRIPKTLTIFLIAAFVALAVQPIVVVLERRVSRPVAIAIVYAALFAMTTAFIFLIVPAAVSQLQALLVSLPGDVALLQTLIDQGEGAVRTHFGKSLPPGLNDIQSLISLRVGSAVNAGIASIGAVVVGAVTALFVLVSAIVLSCFLLLQSASLGATFTALFPVERRLGVRTLGADLAHVFGQYVAGQIVVCFATGIGIWVCLAFLHFRYALIVAILSGIAYGIPLVGMLVIQILAAALALSQGWQLALYVTIAIFVVARIADNVLVPKIMSDSLGVSPVAIMFAVFAGGELFGLPGLLLGIPAAAFVKLTWQFIRSPVLPVTETPTV